MKALLWKEVRENRIKFAMGLGLIVLIHILRIEEGFEAELVKGLFRGLYVVGGGIVSILLAMDLVASERSNGTLDFTLTRPVSPFKFLAAKFIVGAGALLVLHTLFWLSIYDFQDDLVSTASSEKIHVNYYDQLVGQDPSYDLDRVRSAPAFRIMDTIPVSRMILLAYLVHLIPFAFTFIWSTMSPNSTIASAGGVIMFIFYSLGVSAFGAETIVLGQWDPKGHILRVATDFGYTSIRILVLTLTCLGILGLATWYLSRFRQYQAGWRVLLVLVALFISGAYVNSRMVPDETRLRPDTVFEFGKALRDLERDGDIAYVVYKNGLATIDIADPASPNEMHRSELEGWTPYNVELSGDRAFVFAHRNDKTQGDWDDICIIVFDISDPSNLKRLPGETTVALGDELEWRSPPVGDGETAYFSIATKQGVSMIPVDLTGESPRIGNRVKIGALDWTLSSRFRPIESRFELADDVIYIGTSEGLIIFDRTDRMAPTLVETRDLGDFYNPQYIPRCLAVDGSRLYITRSFPQELVTFDISDPRAPVELGFTLNQRSPQKVSATGGRVFLKPSRDKLEAHIAQNGRLANVSEVWMGLEETWERQGGEIFEKDGRVIALMGTKLVTHPLGH